MKVLAVVMLAAGAVPAIASAVSAPSLAQTRNTVRGAAAPTRAGEGTASPTGSGYYVPNIRDAAGNPVPIMEIPGSVAVVPRQVMDDQQAISVCDALRNVSGVSCR